MATEINRVLLTGNLTQDPELHTTESGFAICTLRIASNTSRKNNATGEWEDRPNYFTVKVLGKSGENASKYLQKGRPIALEGRLEWREYQTKDGEKRQTIEVVVDLNGTLKFLGTGGAASTNGGGAVESMAVPAGDDGDNLPF